MKLTYLIASVFIFSSCFTTYTYTLEPEPGTDIQYKQGRSHQTQIKNNIEVDLAYQKYISREYIFSIKISNGSDAPILIDPSLISIENCYDDPTKNNIRKAIDPEFRIAELNEDIRQTEASIKTDNTLNFIGGVLNAAVAVSEMKNDVPEAQRDERRVDREEAKEMHEESVNSKNHQIEKYNKSLNYWEEYSIRKTTINSLEYHDGFFHASFPYSPKVKVVVPVGGQLFEFRFNMNHLY